MFIEVDVSEGENCPEALTLMFNGLAEPVPVSRVRTPGLDGPEVLCAVTGWSQEGPCQAYSAPVEESGEGEAILVFGGDQGIRLRPLESDAEWDLTSPEQWGEVCLLLPPNVEIG